jgi:hypothetical protein
LSTSPVGKLRAKDEERRQAKRNTIADKLTVEAKALADLKIEKAAVEGDAIEEAAKRRKTNTALSAIEDQRSARVGLASERRPRRGTCLLGRPKPLDRNRDRAHPLRGRIARQRHRQREGYRWLMALMVLCCDPLAIALTAAASARH